MERFQKSVSTPSSSSVWSPTASTSKTCWVRGEREADKPSLSLGGKTWVICPGQPNVLWASLCVHLGLLRFRSVHWRNVATVSHGHTRSVLKGPGRPETQNHFSYGWSGRVARTGVPASCSLLNSVIPPLKNVNLAHLKNLYIQGIYVIYIHINFY